VWEETTKVFSKGCYLGRYLYLEENSIVIHWNKHSSICFQFSKNLEEENVLRTMHFMVAIDGSASSKSAFFSALNFVNSPSYKISLLTVVELPEDPFFFPVEAEDIYKDRLIRDASLLLTDYHEFCKSKNINSRKVIVTSLHSVGEMICLAVEKFQVEVLFIGRRGIGTLQRLFIGSNSSYCVENAKSSVLVVKESLHSPELEKEFEIFSKLAEKKLLEKLLSDKFDIEQEIRKLEDKIEDVEISA